MKSDKKAFKLLVLMCGCVLIVLFAHELVTNKPFDTVLEHRLENVRAHVNNVNYGGCGFTALYIKDYCDSAGYDAQIIQLGEPFNHFMVRVGDTYIDSDGFFNRFYPKIFTHECFVITEDELIFKLDDSSIWNKNFNRSDTTLLKQYLLCPNLPNL